MCHGYYETIDTIFDKLVELYGINKDLIEFKEELIDAYEKSKGRGSCNILDKLEMRRFKINQNGYIESI